MCLRKRHAPAFAKRDEGPRSLVTPEQRPRWPQQKHVLSQQRLSHRELRACLQCATALREMRAFCIIHRRADNSEEGRSAPCGRSAELHRLVANEACGVLSEKAATSRRDDGNLRLGFALQPAAPHVGVPTQADNLLKRLRHPPTRFAVGTLTAWNPFCRSCDCVAKSSYVVCFVVPSVCSMVEDSLMLPLHQLLAGKTPRVRESLMQAWRHLQSRPPWLADAAGSLTGGATKERRGPSARLTPYHGACRLKVVRRGGLQSTWVCYFCVGCCDCVAISWV